MDDEIARVRAAYDSDPQREWDRLTTRAQFRLEYLITMHALARQLPPVDRPRRVLDAGGGPGRYTIALAARGYTLTLLDLSPGLLDLARARIAAAGEAVLGRVEAIAAGSITDLSGFPAGHFDAVLCLGGPLSHLPEAAQRSGAVAELRRVVAPGGRLFVSVMNRLGAYRSVVQWPGCYPQYLPHLPQSGLATIGPGAPAYHFLPEEFVALLAGADLEVLDLYGCNGIGAHLQEDHLLALMADPVRWPEWERLLLATSNHPSVVGVSNHLLAVARCPAGPAARSNTPE